VPVHRQYEWQGFAEYYVRVWTIAERHVSVWRNAEEDLGFRTLFGSYRRDAAVRPLAGA
jgi:hypothetical protein